ncbi:MAG TPA: THUMP domain-containing protein [Anaeromyxobacter sp.]
MPVRFYATCAKGTEGALRRELAALKLPRVRGDRGGVTFEGELVHGMRACLHARTAMRVLLELGRFEAPDQDALYEGVHALAWEDWLTTRTTLAVEASVTSSAITHSGYAALKVKDAVVDRLREKLGARPDVDTKDPDFRIVLHLARGEAAVSLDLAGEPLHRRGLRTAITIAPLKETLAAAVLALGGVDLALPFVDPMAGSGTLAIEHALRARKIAPGLARAFGFQRWPVYRGGLQSEWDRMKEAARAEILPRAPAPIVARDLHPKALAALRANLARAGLEADVTVEEGDARELAPRFPHGTLVTNPPYGERMMSGDGEGERRGGRMSPPRSERGDRGGASSAKRSESSPATMDKKIAGFYRGLADMLLRHSRWTVVVLSGNPALSRAVRLKPEIEHRLWNGPLEVRLLRWRIP